MTLAPVALFIYKRPHHTRRTIASLQECPEFSESPIYVFADGPKSPRDLDAVTAARNVAREMLGPRATYLERETNFGLANSIIEGVATLCAEHRRVIVVEDDLVVSPQFLEFMNRGLDEYEHTPQVMQVSGHMFDVPEIANTNKALFLPLTTSWGWGTWKRAWDHFDLEATGWEVLLKDPTIRRRFDLNGAYPYSKMLKRQMAGEIDSWAIRWYYTMFTLNGVGLFPPVSLVRNVGFDGSGTHTKRTRHESFLHDNPSKRTRDESFLHDNPFPTWGLPSRVDESAFKHAVFRTIARESRSIPLPTLVRALEAVARQFTSLVRIRPQ